MKKTVFNLILILCLTLPGVAQSNSFSGIVKSSGGQILVGANVVVEGTSLGTTTDSNGEFLLKNVGATAKNIKVSYVGYSSKEIIASPGVYLEIVLEEQAMGIDPVVVTAQKKEEQAVDVPIALSVVEAGTIESLNVQGLDQLSDIVPGLNIRVQTNARPSYVLRGLTSDEVSPNAQPRVSVYQNHVPIDRASGAVVELYDMERVEVVKGPQGTLFGRGAQIGAVHFVSKKPEKEFGGNVSIGAGTFAQQEVRTTVNVPVSEKLQTRFAGIYSSSDGYIENTFGENLNGKKTLAGRFSARYQPSKKTIFDLVVDFQDDDAPGTGFSSRTYANANGETDVFSYTTSLDKGDSLANEKTVFGASLNIKHSFTPNTSINSISSFRNIDTYSRWDGDGSAAPAIDMSEDNEADQFYQEFRVNYKPTNWFSGFTGVSYWYEEAEQNYWFSPDETYMAYLLFDFLEPEYMVSQDGIPIALPTLSTPYGEIPLSTHHEEASNNRAENKSISAFTDASLRFSSRFEITGGLRFVYDDALLANESLFLLGPSVIGSMGPNAPNLFFRPAPLRDTSATYTGITGRLIAKYKIADNLNIFGTYSRGRRSNVLQYQADGTADEFAAEIVDAIDLGAKFYHKNLSVDLSLFYYDYSHFQTNTWDTITNDYVTKDAGMASSYGLETSIRYAISENISCLASYNFIKTEFDKKDDKNEEQEFAGNQFRLTPEHSFSLAAKIQYPISEKYLLFIVPSYSYRSHIYFEDANTEGLEQDAYGLLNANLGLKMKKPNLTLSLYANNILDEEYIISAGNTGSLFGIPTYIAGMPMMMGAKLGWVF